jgi:hypothetical protein
MEINWLSPVCQGRKRGGHASSGIRVSTHKAGTRLFQTSFTVNKDVMEKMGWLAGDRVLIGTNDQFIFMKRVPENGYTLSAIGNSPEERTNRRGKPVTCTVKISKKIIDKNIIKKLYELSVTGSVLNIKKEL